MLYKTRPTKDANVVLDARWKLGVLLGKTWGSTINRVMIEPRRVIEVRAIQRVPQTERWDRVLSGGFLATPSQWVVPEDWELEPGVMLQPREGPAPAAVLPSEPQLPRRVYLTEKDFAMYGYTTNCRRCQYTHAGRKTQAMNHTGPCRKRIEEKLRDA